jgi:hypothetical protein
MYPPWSKSKSGRLRPGRYFIRIAAMQRILCSLILICTALLGCHPEKNDSHTEVFKTPDQLATDRNKQLLQSHQELAISVLKFARPDLQTQITETGIVARADGVEKQIDLLQIENELIHNANHERPIIRRYLDTQLRPFDQQRLQTLGFDKVRPMVRYELVNRGQLEQMQKDYPRAPICSAEIVPNLFRATVIQSGGTEIPVDRTMLQTWHIGDAELDAAAGAALKQIIAQAGPNLFETINYPTFGDCGALKVDGSVMLAPEFLAAVQQQWKTTDNLVVFMPSPHSVQFVASHNQKLLGLLNPQWQKVVGSLADPLYKLLLLRSADSISAYVFTPVSKPAVTQPATKPEIFIVN